MTTGICIFIVLVVVVCIAMVCLWFYLKSKEANDVDEPIVEPPTFEESQGEIDTSHNDDKPKDEIHPLFKVGDCVVNKFGHIKCITKIENGCYYAENNDENTEWSGTIEYGNEHFHLWTINDAKDGDILYSDSFAKIIFMFKGIDGEKILFYCDCNAPCDGNLDFQVAQPKEYFGYTYERDLRPATSDERTYLMTAMRDAGYAWDVDSHSVIDVEPVEQSNEDKFLAMFDELVGYFNNVVTIHEGGYTYVYLLRLCNYALDTNSDVVVNLRKNFPCVLDYFTNKEYGFAFEKTCAWIFALVLVELMPKKRDALFQMAYDYKEKGSEVPTFGWSLQSDPNIGRMCAFAIVNTFYDINKMNDMRSEVGGSMLTYKNDISETFVGIEKFLPPAPQPYIKG